MGILHDDEEDLRAELAAVKAELQRWHRITATPGHEGKALTPEAVAENLAALLGDVERLEAERDNLLASDWLGLLTRQPNFGDNGTHTWADSIAAYLGLEPTDDAQTLYIKLVERDGELVEIERQRDEALAALGKVRELANHLRNGKPTRMPDGASVQFGSAFSDAILTIIGGKS